MKCDTKGRLAILALGLFWAPLIYQLSAQWSFFEQYNYGYAVPFLCLYLIFLRNSKGRVQSHTELSFPSPTNLQYCRFVALAVLVVSVGCLLPVRWLHEANPVWRLTTWAWAISLVGLTLSVVYLCRGGQEMQRISFAVAFFLVAVPWPSAFEGALGGGLALNNAKATVEALGMLGVPAIQHGSVIEIAKGNVGINEACSGIRSLQATLMIVLFLGEVYSLPGSRRIFAVFLGFSLDFLFNILRTTLLAYVAATKGMLAMGAWHDPAGVMILVGCFLGVWAVVVWIKRWDRKRQNPKFRAQSAAEISVQPSTSPLIHESTTRSWSSVLPRILIVWFLLVEFAVEGWYRWHEHRRTTPLGWAIHPERLSARAQVVPVSSSLRDAMKCDQGIHVKWYGAQGEGWQMYYFNWQRSMALKRRIAVLAARSHRPEVCLSASGMKLVSELGSAPMEFNGVTLDVEQYVFEGEGQQLHVFFGVYDDSSRLGILTSQRLDFRGRILAALAGNRNYSQCSLEVAVSGIETPEHARERFIQEVTPLVENR